MTILRLAISFSLCLGVTAQPQETQLVQINQEDFSDEVRKLDFYDFRSGNGANRAENFFRSLGIRFLGEKGSTPRAEAILVSRAFPGTVKGIILNEPAGGTSEDSALTILFEHPVRRVGFQIGNGKEDTVATIRALTPQGEALGEILQSGIQHSGELATEIILGPFVGLETEHPEGIGAVSIDYSDDSVEQIHRLFMDFIEPPAFTYYVPQVAHGQAGDYFLQTMLGIRWNYIREDSSITVSFFSQSGEPMQLPIDGGEVSQIVSGDWFFFVTTSGAVDSPRVGYAVVESEYPLNVNTIYMVNGSDGRRLSEAGVASAEGGFKQRAIIEIDRGIGLDTGVAMINTGDQLTYVDVRFYTDDGVDLSGINSIKIPLLPGEHVSLFPHDMFQIYGYTWEQKNTLRGIRELRGGMTFSSNQPVAIATLRTVNGLPVSSLQVGDSFAVR